MKRWVPSAFGLRLQPRGELFVSLLAIGLAVAVPAAALVWTTLRTWDRDRRDGAQELQAIHRFRLEEAVRTLDAELAARAHRSGRRDPVPAAEAGVVFRELAPNRLAGSRPKGAPEGGAPDGLLVLAADGAPLYPAPAIGGLHPSDADRRGEALVAAFHQRLITQSMGEAYLGLAAQLMDQHLEGSRSPSGRLYLPGIQWAALQQLPPEDPRFGATLEALTRQVMRYEAPLVPASQRLFLAREVRKLGGQPGLPTESAEALGLAVVQSLAGPPSRELRVAMKVHPSGDGPGEEVWLLPAPGGGVIWLYSQDRLHRELEARVNQGLEALGYRARLGPQSPTSMAFAGSGVGSSAELQASLGASLPGWELRLDASAAAASMARAARRQAAFLVASASSAVMLGAVLAFLAIRRFLQRVRLAEVRHDFLTTVSHELRTPMTSIRMLIESLVADPDPSPERTRSYLEVVSRETVRLGRLVDDYLTFARLERGRMNYDFQPTSPETVVEAAVRSVGPRFAAPGCDFRTEMAEALPLIRADVPSLTTALLNLLENAHKYTGTDKRILLTLTRAADGVRFTVTDNGRGFDPRHRSRIFEKFHRVDEAVGAVTGAGLGLHIVRSIVEAHGGRVEVETTPGEGSRFTILLPALPDAANEPPQSP
ncbi:MAG: sensor histidine kinase [Verrucomicrobiota bacterium]